MAKIENLSSGSDGESSLSNEVVSKMAHSLYKEAMTILLNIPEFANSYYIQAFKSAADEDSIPYSALIKFDQGDTYHVVAYSALDQNFKALSINHYGASERPDSDHGISFSLAPNNEVFMTSSSNPASIKTNSKKVFSEIKDFLGHFQEIAFSDE